MTVALSTTTDANAPTTPALLLASSPAPWPSADQDSRRSAALEPAHAPVDGRTEIDSLAFVANFAQLVLYYDLTKTLAAHWDQLISDDSAIALATVAYEAKCYSHARFDFLLESLRLRLDAYRIALVRSLRSIALLKNAAGKSALGASASLLELLIKLDPTDLQATILQLEQTVPWVDKDNDALGTGTEARPSALPSHTPPQADSKERYSTLLGFPHALAPRPAGSTDTETLATAIAANPEIGALGPLGSTIRAPFPTAAGGPPKLVQDLLLAIDALNLAYYDHLLSFWNWFSVLDRYGGLETEFKSLVLSQAYDPVLALSRFTRTLFQVIPTQINATAASPKPEDVVLSFTQSQLLTFVTTTQVFVDTPKPDPSSKPADLLRGAPIRLAVTLASINTDLARVYRRLVRTRRSIEDFATKRFFANYTQPKGDHRPDKAVALAIVRLLQRVRHQANELTGQHLDFYYRSLLGMRPGEIVPDRAVLLLQPTQPGAQALLPTGTQFLGGNDTSGNPIVFELLTDAVVDGTLVGDLRTLLTAPASASTTAPPSPRVLADLPLARPAPADGSAPPPLCCFGAPASSSSAADFGFAIASPILRLAGGQRLVELVIWVPPSTYAALSDLSGANASFERLFACCLSGAASWIVPDRTELRLVPATEKVLDLPGPALVLELHLGMATAGVTDFDPVALTSAGSSFQRSFPAGPPILVVRRNQAASPFPQPWDFDSFEKWALRVSVKGLANLTLQNDSGPLPATKPFQPFGAKPTPDSSLIIGCPEALQKRLESLEIQWTWKSPPPALAAYYGAYESTLLSGLADLDTLAGRLRTAPPQVPSAQGKPAPQDPARVLVDALSDTTRRLLGQYPELVAKEVLQSALLTDLNQLPVSATLALAISTLKQSPGSAALIDLIHDDPDAITSTELVARLSRSLLNDFGASLRTSTDPDPIDLNPIFRFGWDILSQGDWQPFQTFPLLTLPEWVLHWPPTLSMPFPALLSATPPDSDAYPAPLPASYSLNFPTASSYVPGTQQGFLRLRLLSPAFGFGQDLYPKLISAAKAELVAAQQALLAPPPPGLKAPGTPPSNATPPDQAQTAEDHAKKRKSFLDFLNTGLSIGAGVVLGPAAGVLAQKAGSVVEGAIDLAEDAKAAKAEKVAAGVSEAASAGQTSTTSSPLLPSLEQRRLLLAQQRVQQINPPVVPTWSSIAIHYQARLVCGEDLGAYRVFDILPFGYANNPDSRLRIVSERLPGTFQSTTALRPSNPPSPNPNHTPTDANASDPPDHLPDATVFVGLKGAVPGQKASLYFRLAAGTASPTTQPTPPAWWYLSPHGWKSLPRTHILSDGTASFSTTGIVLLQLPSSVSTTATEMPPGLLWLAVIVDRNSNGIDNLFAIDPNATVAQWKKVPGQSAARNFPLAAGTITKLATPDARIKTILQPEPSYGGIPPEEDAAYRVRVSERLRHRNRAVTVWDYERLLLGAFPQVRKVMVLKGYRPAPAPPPANEPLEPGPWNANPRLLKSPGSITLVVIPTDFVVVPTWGFAPLVTPSLKAEIREFFAHANGLSRMSDRVQLEVVGPFFERVTVIANVTLSPEADPTTAQATLADVISSAISPWLNGTGTPDFEPACSVARIVSALTLQPTVLAIRQLQLGANPVFQDQTASTAYSLFAASVVPQSITLRHE